MNRDISSLYGILSRVAKNPQLSLGRVYSEIDSDTRSSFQRDRDRIIHSSAFRRLKYKTQVFVYYEGDNYRTRLSHSLEVSQIARSIGRFLGLNEDLIETLSLAHDLGHTCFGHAGEEALQGCMHLYNGFDHNLQTLRIITKLEQSYPEFDGLNLTLETLEGIIKHNGPILEKNRPGYLTLVSDEYLDKKQLRLSQYGSAESQVAAIADDIAYNAHDIYDGLKAELFSIEDLKSIDLIGPIVSEVSKDYGHIEESRQAHEISRRLIRLMVNDVLIESAKRYQEYTPLTHIDVHNLGVGLIGFSPETLEKEKALKNFLFPNMYRHNRVAKMTDKAREVVCDLFKMLHNEPNLLPKDWNLDNDGPGGKRTARRVADYIAGMTDRFALKEHHRLFGGEVKL